MRHKIEPHGDMFVVKEKGWFQLKWKYIETSGLFAYRKIVPCCLFMKKDHAERVVKHRKSKRWL